MSAYGWPALLGAMVLLLIVASAVLLYRRLTVEEAEQDAIRLLTMVVVASRPLPEGHTVTKSDVTRLLKRLRSGSRFDFLNHVDQAVGKTLSVRVEIGREFHAGLFVTEAQSAPPISGMAHVTVPLSKTSVPGLRRGDRLAFARDGQLVPDGVDGGAHSGYECLGKIVEGDSQTLIVGVPITELAEAAGLAETGWTPVLLAGGVGPDGSRYARSSEQDQGQ